MKRIYKFDLFINRKKYIALWIIIGLILLTAIIIGPLDGFSHGFYSNEIGLVEIDDGDLEERISLESASYEMIFTPQREHFAGFSIYLTNQPKDNTGYLLLSISDLKGRTVDEISIDLNKVDEGSWYKVYVNSTLKRGNAYRLVISANECMCYPQLQTINSNYLPKETNTGNLFIAYAYKESTFSLSKRVIIFLSLILLCALLINHVYIRSKRLHMMVFMLFMAMVLAWNYNTGSMNVDDNTFENFESNSQSLIEGLLYTDECEGYIWVDEKEGYGLGLYNDVIGNIYQKSNDWIPISDDSVYRGYSKILPALVINRNDYTERVLEEAKAVEFENGIRLLITGFEIDGERIIIFLNESRALNPIKYGDLESINFIGEDDSKLPHALITTYKSQYGLHGKLFRWLSKKILLCDKVEWLELICSLVTALVFVLICYVITKKYNHLMGICFYTVFWLSPWIVNFARNLYWIEFSWFLPMAIGLICSWKLDSKQIRVTCYAATFFSILFKSLCGYEYLSTIMLGLISFLMADFVVSLKRNRSKSRKIFTTMIIIGIVALFGFVTAVVIHANVRGAGDIVTGIKEIINQDLLRRTNGADFNEFDSRYYNSFNASIPETVALYFKFPTEIIAGVLGSLFPVLCIAPLGKFVYMTYRKKNMGVEPVLYLVFFITTISWFCLAKSHSYYHTHLNFVLWYFGFVQICFYEVISGIISLLGTDRVKSLNLRL